MIMIIQLGFLSSKLLEVGFEAAEEEIIEFLDFDSEHMRHPGDGKVFAGGIIRIVVGVNRLGARPFLFIFSAEEGLVEHRIGSGSERIIPK